MNFEIFDENYYLIQYPWVKTAIESGQFTSGLDHFQKIGMGQQKLTEVSRYFDESYYLANNPDVANGVAGGLIPSGLSHFIQFGYEEGRTNISPSYSEDYYLKRYPDLVAFIQNSTFKSGLQHFLQFGQTENRLATHFFEPEYLQKNPDVNLAVAQGNFKTGFDHYLKVGQFEPSRSAIFMGTNGTDTVQGLGVGTVEITGIPLSLDGTGKRVYERDKNQNPVDQQDTLIGGLGSDQFILGDEGSSFKSWFSSPTTIINLDPTQDTIQLGGLISSHTQWDDGSADLLIRERFAPTVEVVIKDGADFPTNYPIVEWIKSSIVTTIGDFGESFYLHRNPDVLVAVEAGAFSTGLEHYQKFGQFEPSRSTAFMGTQGNDTVTAFGVGEKDIIGVLTEYTYAYRYLSNGENEFDTLIGSEGADNFIFADFYIVGKIPINTIFEFYLGLGEATIRNFNQSQGDTIQLIGQLEDYQISPVGKDLVISKNGDTIVRLEAGADLNLQVIQPPSVGYRSPFTLG
ncbi:Hemolysin-type calcium-binding region protein [Planktothrix serta PCC 8927]|uniref:Hemolysin-type calcium-binding region protein n=1 Tax=Planktothrix serta PCC 8927 TaxID=671068 RepID=A0A7Z9BIN4_9CYAN|nr:hypothetical protein [Planktothrix serta]VXD12305.1 Hemolysin-type calcium-binding region protein [Planktothrix serta PCC 8927]